MNEQQAEAFVHKANYFISLAKTPVNLHEVCRVIQMALINENPCSRLCRLMYHVLQAWEQDNGPADQ